MANDARTYFFSYSRADFEVVLKLATELRAAGADLWLDQLDIVGGQHWDTEVESALTRCDGVLCVLSPEAIASKNVMDEVSYALEKDKLIIPILLRPCDIPFRLRRVHHVDFTGDYPRALGQLKRAAGVDPAPLSQDDGTDETPAAESETKYLEKGPAEPPNVKSSKAPWFVAGGVLLAAGIGLAVYQPWTASPPDAARVEVEQRAEVEEMTPERAATVSEEPAVEDLDKEMVALSNTNVREGPGTEYGKLTTLSRGAPVKVSGHVEDWYRVALDGGGEGYVFKELLGESTSETATDVAARAPKTLEPGDTFKDCDVCPEMVVVPAGSFLMGSPPDEPERAEDEGPQHRVTIAKPSAVGVYEVTFAEWDACVEDGGCGGYRPEDGNWGRDRKPVINVSWNDAQAYVQWLSNKTGKSYRLLTEAEWEYAARAGTTTPFYFGSTISTGQANYEGNYTYNGGATGEYRRKTVPVGSFPANEFGLYDVHGNVWEWVADCYDMAAYNTHKKYPAMVGSFQDSCYRVLRGGSWVNIPRNLRSANRIRYIPGDRNLNVGFRVARTLF